MKISVFLGKCFAFLFPYNINNSFQAIKVRYELAKNENYFKKKCKGFGCGCRIYEPARIGGLENVSIGNQFTMGEGGILETIPEYHGVVYSPTIEIKNNVSIGKRCHIGAINYIQIGNNVLTGANVLITDHAHGNSIISDIKKSPRDRDLYSKGKVIIGDNVWIGDKATILPGVEIGCNVIIGANSVVTHSIPDNAVACGNPARVLKIIS